MMEKIKSMKNNEAMRQMGEFHIDNMLKRQGKVKVLGEFLWSGIAEVIKECYRGMQKGLVTPLTYNAEQFHKVISPALVRATQGFVMKSPVRVEWCELEEQMKSKMDVEWADYRCRYKGYNYCIEVNKRSISYTAEHLIDEVKEEWKTSCEKLRGMKNAMASDEKRNTFNITVEILNVYISDSDETSLSYSKQELEKLKNKIIQEISREYPVKCACMWVLNEKIVKEYEYIHGIEKYPAVLFLAHVE